MNVFRAKGSTSDRYLSRAHYVALTRIDFNTNFYWFSCELNVKLMHWRNTSINGKKNFDFPSRTLNGFVLIWKSLCNTFMIHDGKTETNSALLFHKMVIISESQKFSEEQKKNCYSYTFTPIIVLIWTFLMNLRLGYLYMCCLCSSTFTTYLKAIVFAGASDNVTIWIRISKSTI